MSWDIFVQDLPENVQAVQDIPDDFEPGSLGLKRTELIHRMQEIAPEADFSDPAWGRLDGDGYSIEINLGDDEVVSGFAFHVRGDERAPYMVQQLLDGLKLRALDPSADSGIFSLSEGSVQGFARWRSYRDRVIKS